MITINLDKAKDITHNFRREVRAKEFAPLDIKATIPSEAAVAEAARQEVRDRHAEIQTNIDSAKSVDDLKTIVESLRDI